jgi:hypothetical protein
MVCSVLKKIQKHLNYQGKRFNVLIYEKPVDLFGHSYRIGKDNESQNIAKLYQKYDTIIFRITGLGFGRLFAMVIAQNPHSIYRHDSGRPAHPAGKTQA